MTTTESERKLRQWPRERIKPATVARCIDLMLRHAEQSRLWTARLRAAASDYRERARHGRESVQIALHQIQQLTARAEAAERQAEALRERMRDALDCLPRALDGSQPFSMGQRAEVMLAIESLRNGLAASPPAAPAVEPAEGTTGR